MVRIIKEKLIWLDEVKKTCTLAIDDVRNNVKNLRKATRAHNIPVMTLSDRCKSGSAKKADLGRKATFTEEQENEIVQQVLLLANMFYGISSI